MTDLQVPLEIQSLILRYVLESTNLSEGLALRRITRWTNNEVIRCYCTHFYDAVYDYVFSSRCSSIPWEFLWPYFKGWLSVFRAKEPTSIRQTRIAIVAALARHGHNRLEDHIDDLPASRLLQAIITGNGPKDVFRACYGRKFEDGILAQSTAYWDLLLNCHIGATQDARKALKDVYNTAYNHWLHDDGCAKRHPFYPGRDDSPLEITATCLRIAVKAGHFNTALMLLEENERDVWPHDFSFPAPQLYVRALLIALQDGQSQVVQGLLSLPRLKSMALNARINTIWTHAKDDFNRDQMLRFVVGNAVAETHQLSTLESWTNFAAQIGTEVLVDTVGA